MTVGKALESPDPTIAILIRFARLPFFYGSILVLIMLSMQQYILFVNHVRKMTVGLTFGHEVRVFSSPCTDFFATKQHGARAVRSTARPILSKTSTPLVPPGTNDER